MPCYFPLQAWRTPTGVVWSPNQKGAGDAIKLPCRQCIGCRLERSRQWATRIMFESQLHDASSFVTLTYAEHHLPRPPSLDPRAMQLFIKRLRKQFPDRKIRYFLCGEYGDENKRPHYHLCLFGVDFSHDRLPLSPNARGDALFSSATLDKLWPFGRAVVGNLSFESAAYVARYCVKKVTGDLADAHYRALDVDTGELVPIEPEFARMSLKPGLGGRWFDLYSSDIYNGHDYVVVRGVRCRPPRYFDRLYRRMYSHEFELLKSERVAGPYDPNNSDERLAVRHAVKQAAISQLKRNL